MQYLVFVTLAFRRAQRRYITNPTAENYRLMQYAYDGVLSAKIAL